MANIFNQARDLLKNLQSKATSIGQNAVSSWTNAPVAGGLAGKAIPTLNTQRFNPVAQTRAAFSMRNAPPQQAQFYRQQVRQATPQLNIAQNIQNPYLRFAGQVGEGFVNVFPNAVSGALKLPAARNFQQGASDIASIAEAPLSLAGFGVGKQIAKEGIKQVFKQGVKQSIKQGAKTGAIYGGAFGGLEGLREGEYDSVLKQLGKAILGAGTGVVAGGVLGGTLSGAGALLKKYIFKSPQVEQQLRDSAGRWIAGERPVKPKGMAQPAWDFQLKFNAKHERNPYTPVYVNDLSRELPQPGLSIKYTKGLEGGGVKVGLQPKVLQTPKTPEQRLLNQAKAPEVMPQTPGTPGGGTGGSSSGVIIPQKGKYAFNINKPKLGLKGEAAAKLDATVEQMRPVLEHRKGRPLTDKEIIASGRKAQLLDTVMSRKESAEFSAALQASRNFLKSEAAKKGLTPEFLAQLEIVSSHASDKGRSLRSFAVDAENMGIKEVLVKDLQKLGIETKRLVDAAKNVDWEDAAQVTAFYRKFKPATFFEKLEEYRYVNMLSSPNTHIINIFSNLIQGGVVTPIEKTVTGSLDFARARLTGTEQKYFASQGIDYAKGYWKSLPDGWKKFRSIISGSGGLNKPDVNFIPTGTGKLHKAYTTPLRALEASDQFFRSLVIGGEKASLKRTGMSEAQAVVKAEAEATYRTFRQAFDPEGKLGQGGLLKVWDKWNVGINHLRQLPGGRWIVPFLQTPTNILKQGVEYSPLGFSTIPGSKEPMVQLSKAIIGSGVFTGAYALADAGLTTWDTPINKKDKEAFNAAGLQPYSVKIGGQWVSYSKLGPLSYPIAMAAAMKWAKDNGAEEDALAVAGTGVGGFLQFFADQSYMQGIGDVIDAVRGDEFKQGRSLANIPSQLIPYRAFQGWVARLIDPVYRKTSGDGILDQAAKSVVSQVPFASKTLEPYRTSAGEESKRSQPFLNAVSPVKTSLQVEPYVPGSAKGIYGEFRKLKTPQEKAQLWDQLVKDGKITKDNVSDIKQQFNDEKLGLKDSEVRMRNLGVADKTRAYRIAEEFNRVDTPEEKAALWDKYVKAKIITKDVAKQLKVLLQN